MTARLSVSIAAAVFAGVLAASSEALAQQKPRPGPARPHARSRSVQIGGYAMLGRFSFAARESFDAILGQSSGPIFGGGARVGIPYGGLFAEIGAWRFTDSGERVFVVNDQVYPLNIPTEIAVTPIEISGGWQFRFRRLPKLLPYAAAGLTAMKYRETSDFATDAENVDRTFSGFHVFAGAEYKVTRWLGVAGEAAWTSIADAIGDSGVSKAFNETNLGGSSFRLKITVGR